MPRATIQLFDAKGHSKWVNDLCLIALRLGAQVVYCGLKQDTYLTGGKLGEGIAKPGDWIVLDPAGPIVYDEEAFETHYVSAECNTRGADGPIPQEIGGPVSDGHRELGHGYDAFRYFTGYDPGFTLTSGSDALSEVGLREAIERIKDQRIDITPLGKEVLAGVTEESLEYTGNRYAEAQCDRAVESDFVQAGYCQSIDRTHQARLNGQYWSEEPENATRVPNLPYPAWITRDGVCLTWNGASNRWEPSPLPQPILDAHESWVKDEKAEADAKRQRALFENLFAPEWTDYFVERFGGQKVRDVADVLTTYFANAIESAKDKGANDCRTSLGVIAKEGDEIVAVGKNSAGRGRLKQDNDGSLILDLETGAQIVPWHVHERYRKAWEARSTDAERELFGGPLLCGVAPFVAYAEVKTFPDGSSYLNLGDAGDAWLRANAGQPVCVEIARQATPEAPAATPEEYVARTVVHCDQAIQALVDALCAKHGLHIVVDIQASGTLPPHLQV